MIEIIIIVIYYSVLLVSLIAILFHKIHTKSSGKWLARLFAATIFFEVCSEIATSTFNNNMYVYHVWSPLELMIIALYFNEKIATLKKYSVGKIVASVGITIAIINSIFLQPLNTINSIFLMYEGFAIIGLCLYAFYDLVQKEEEILKNSHFWISTIFLIYWSVVFVYWGMYQYLLTVLNEYMGAVTYFVWIVTILAYASFAVLFVNYRKLESSNG